MNNEYLQFSSKQELFEKVIRDFLEENPITLKEKSFFDKFLTLSRNSLGNFTQYLGGHLPFITSIAVAASGRHSYTSLGYSLALYPAIQLAKLGEKIKGIPELKSLNFFKQDGTFDIDKYEDFNNSILTEISIIEKKIKTKR
jgi:hypothetical protein